MQTQLIFLSASFPNIRCALISFPGISQLHSTPLFKRSLQVTSLFFHSKNVLPLRTEPWLGSKVISSVEPSLIPSFLQSSPQDSILGVWRSEETRGQNTPIRGWFMHFAGHTGWEIVLFTKLSSARAVLGVWLVLNKHSWINKWPCTKLGNIESWLIFLGIEDITSWGSCEVWKILKLGKAMQTTSNHLEDTGLRYQ